MKKVLVTGATGFIGGHLVMANLKQGRWVRAFVLPNDPGAGALKEKGVEVFTGDITDPASVARAAAGVDLIFHAAAVVTDWAPRSLFNKVTIGGAHNVCRAALDAGVSRVVYLSTNDVFGTDESRVINESWPLKPWGEPYPDTKVAAEQAVWRYHRENGLPVTMAYPCWVYGEGDRTFVPLLADAIVKKEMLFWRKDVLVWPTYIENLTDLLLTMAADDRAVGEGFLVHDGESATLQDFCAGIANALSVPPPTRHIPYFAAYGAAVVLETVWKAFGVKNRPLLTTYAVKNLGSRLKFSIEKAERVLGWRPKVSYPVAFGRTMEWLKSVDLSEFTGK